MIVTTTERSENMYYSLDELPIKILEKKPKSIMFAYQKKYYFFKPAAPEGILKELVAEKIAKRFGVACCHYRPAIYQGIKGVVSESAYDIIWDVGYKTMSDYYAAHNSPITTISLSKFNNLEDIWDTIYFDSDIPWSLDKKIMNEVTDIFLFDALIGNIDRHGENFGIIPNGKKSRMAPIFDNDKMLSPIAINNGKYNLAVSSGESPISTPGNFLYKFLDISDRAYQKRLKDGLKIISEESLIEIFQELKSEGIIFEVALMEELLEKFAQNRTMINNYFESEKKFYK